jgi:hypothetical protein
MVEQEREKMRKAEEKKKNKKLQMLVLVSIDLYNIIVPLKRIANKKSIDQKKTNKITI